MRPTAVELAATLGLEPHAEGGFFRETYRAADAIRTKRGTRAASTAILFLVTASSPSRFHRLMSDELWVFQGGLPLELVTLGAEGEAHRRLLGDPAVAPGVLPQALAPAGAWQAARVAEQDAAAPRAAGSRERAWSLVTCIVTPGFDSSDFELGRRDELVRLVPRQADLIAELT
jgi:predicted cupin superfamily sugar epimerase